MRIGEDEKMDLTGLNEMTYGMYVIGSKLEGREVGCFVNTVTQVTAEPVKIAVCLHKNNATTEALEKTRQFTVSVLAETVDPKVIGKFGFFSSRNVDKWEAFSKEDMGGLPVLAEEVCATCLCEVTDIVDVGTHKLFIANVLDVKKKESTDAPKVPMTYRYYHEVIKGKAPKTAPTYQE